MDRQISETKVLPPHVHPVVIPRQRLFTLLDECLSYRLFLVIAPAGYGKTTLLTDWARARGIQVGWYSLTEMDLSASRFYQHFVAALQALFPTFGLESMAMAADLNRGEGSVAQFAATVVNELADHVRDDFVFVLDDYHLVDQDEEINLFVSYFVQHTSSACHVVLSSRTLLSLPDLDLMVARSQVSGLDYEELAFRPDEIQSLAHRRFHHELSLDQATALTERAEGWITGLLLSANLRHWLMGDEVRVLRATGIDLYTYFAQQVLDKQAPAVRDFLLKTSLFDEFDADFCSAIFGEDPGDASMDLQAILDYVRRNNLFVSAVGRYGEQIRYHGLFQDFAREKFIQEQPQEVEQLATRLAASYAADQRWEHAYQLFTRLDDIPSQVAFLDRHGRAMLRAGQMQLLARWLGDLPQLVRFDHPSLIALHGAALVSTGATDYGVSILSQVESTLTPDVHDPLRLQVLVSRSAGLRMLGRYDEALADAENALRLAQQVDGRVDAAELAGAVALSHRLKGLVLLMTGKSDPMPWLYKALTGYQSLKNAHDSAVVSMEIGLAYLTTGNFLQAQPWLEGAADTWTHLHNVAGQANVLNNLGYLHYLRGEYQASAAALIKALQAARRSGYRRLEAYIISGLADLMLNIGFDQEAVVVYQRAKTLAKRVNERFLILYIELAETTLAWQLADQEAAYENLNRAGQLVLNRDSDYEWSLYRLTVGRFYVATGKPDDALEPLHDAVEHLSVGNRSIDLVVAQLYLALALAEADPSAGRTTLAQAVANAAAAEYYPHFVAVATREKGPLTALANSIQFGPARDLPAQIQAFEDESVTLRKALRTELFETLDLPDAHTPRLVFCGFGRPEVSVAGNRITSSQWTVTAARDMFFCLLAHPAGLSKEEIGLIFWQDCTIKQLKTRFKNTLYRLRSALPEDVILFDNETYYFNQKLDYTYDVESFLALSERARATNDLHAKTKLLRAALDLYQGPYLMGVDLAWVLGERERLQQVFIDLGLQLASLSLESDQASDALTYCERVLAEDSTLEEAHRLAMRVHAAMGNRNEIANQYARCCTALLDEIGVDPSPQTVSLYERLMA